MMKRFSIKKTGLEPDTKKETRPTTPSETAKPKSFRRRINRLVPPAEKPTDVASPTSTGAKATTNKPSKDEASNKLSSPRRIRRYNQSASGTSPGGNISIPSTPSSRSSKVVGGNGADAPPTKESSVRKPHVIASDKEITQIESGNDNNHSENNSADVSVAEAIDMTKAVLESPKRQLVPWDEQSSTKVSTVSSPKRSMTLEKDNMQRELAKVRLDRDLYRRQLLEARKELENARSSLRDQISDLEDQLRTFQQSERPKIESNDDPLPEETIDPSLQPKKEAISKPVALANERQTEKLRYERLYEKMENYKVRVAELEITLEERQSREQVLENEVREMKTQAQVDAEKLKESQRRVQVLERNTEQVTTQGDKASSESITSSEKNGKDRVIGDRSFSKRNEKEDYETIGKMDGNIQDESPKNDYIKNHVEPGGEEIKASHAAQSKTNAAAGEKSTRIYQRRESSKRSSNQSKNNDEVVHNLHLRLDEEIAKLKRRKERRRERAISNTPPSVRKYRSFLDPSLSSRLLQSDAEPRDVNAGIAPVLIPKSEPEEILTTEMIAPKTARAEGSDVATSEPKLKKSEPDLVDSRSEKERLQTDLKAAKSEAKSEDMQIPSLVPKETPIEGPVHTQPTDLDREKEGSDIEYKLKMKEGDEAQKELGEESTRLALELESVDESKSQLEIQLESAIQQAKESRDQVEKLTSEASVYQSSLEKHEREKTRLVELLETTRKEMVLLENESSLRDESSEETVTKSNAEGNIRDESQALRSQVQMLEGKLAKLEEEKELLIASSKDKVSTLEQRISTLQTESKSNIERLSTERDGVLERRDTVESKFHNASEQLDKSKERELALKMSIEDVTSELKSVQDQFQKLSLTKEQEKTGYELQLVEKNQCISQLKEELSTKEKRLEQASRHLSELEEELFANQPSKTEDEKDKCIADLKEALAGRERRLEQAIEQLMELESELIDRDDEIDQLNAKRMHIEDKASKLLVEMEIVLQKEGEEIDRLEEEKSKLRKAIYKYEEQIEKQVGRLAEASLQLSELESELFAKDDDIEEMELKVNAMQALESQRLEAIEDLENEKNSLEEELLFAHKRIENLVGQIGEIKEENEAERNETRRLLMEEERKDKELLSSKSQVNRQLQNVSKLTEQNDMWQLQLEKVNDEKRELAENLTETAMQANTLREKLEEANEKLKELIAAKAGLKDDLDCAIEEDEKNRRRISQMEEQKEALSVELESAIDNLADLKKHFKESQERKESLSSDIFDKLQANIQAARAADQDTAIQIKNLTDQLESDRQSLKMTKLQQNELETDEQSQKNRTRLLIEFEFEERDSDAVNE
mmetsp:Transcript_18293/g.50980  ORF Transcript_18293/g.50980 Transcript_18293/m.50980 type:complete len:1339 (+) Transcript_18293:353-4369(+)